MKIRRIFWAVAVCIFLVVTCISTMAAEGTNSAEYALLPASITIKHIETVIPQNISAVSTNFNHLTGQNACFDYDSSKLPYSSWESIDYTDTTEMPPDRVLRQARFLVTAKTISGSAVQDAVVKISASIQGEHYIYSPRTTNIFGEMIVYIEYRGELSFTVTASASGSLASDSCTVTSGLAPYRNKFLITNYYLPRRSSFDTWEQFVSAVLLQGSGYDDTTDTYYMSDYNGGVRVSTPQTRTGTTPTEYRTIAVDKPYIPRGIYVSTGSSASDYHRGQIYISSMAGVGDDDGYRIAEDSGSAINGYHIDIFSGGKNAAAFSNLYGKRIPTSNGYFYAPVTYVSTIKGSIN